MFKLVLTFACGLGFGVALMDTANRPAPKTLPAIRQASLGAPIICDATVEQRTKPTEPWSKKCYVARYQR